MRRGGKPCIYIMHPAGPGKGGGKLCMYNYNNNMHHAPRGLKADTLSVTTTSGVDSFGSGWGISSEVYGNNACFLTPRSELYHPVRKPWPSRLLGILRNLH